MNTRLMWSTIKTAILVASLFECLLRSVWLRVEVWLEFGRGPNARERALWLHQCCRQIARRLGIRVEAKGSLPGRGLVVSNHLSHLDILLYGSLGPVIFVSKKDVRSWPLLGQLAAFGGTVFVDREHGAQSVIAARQMQELLRGELPVMLFPEGTSSDGETVLPFRSPMFEAAIQANTPVSAAAISYSADGVQENTLAYYGEKVFFPHLHETLGRPGLMVRLSFAAGPLFCKDRKEAARVTHAIVSSLREIDRQSIVREAQPMEGTDRPARDATPAFS